MPHARDSPPTCVIEGSASHPSRTSMRVKLKIERGIRMKRSKDRAPVHLLLHVAHELLDALTLVLLVLAQLRGGCLGGIRGLRRRRGLRLQLRLPLLPALRRRLRLLSPNVQLSIFKGYVLTLGLKVRVGVKGHGNGWG